ncbi:type II toxin-antitoxin system HigB family toxin [Marinobacter salarius]|jgi:mRNA-degrading endonuclease HigB of HigAB toxin-antitoxin module|uniref:type II toxin-antitoxin system HigB family toxin n=2 Tax=Marinobacteraceae TaxID=2887365 RepID=UPI003969E8BD|tara:strand:+ start:276 stop:545 length:270 start_codon:yes stop_codon:yes gene_type:complete
MRLVGRERVSSSNIGDPSAQAWLSVWMSEISEAQWSSPCDLLDHYPSAQDQGNGMFLFSIGDRGLYLEVLISFSQKIACILHISESNES